MTEWILSFDVGKKGDPSGIGLYRCVPVRASDSFGGAQQIVWKLVLNQQWKWRRMPYTQQASNLAELTGHIKSSMAFVMDGTGIGEAVRDMLIDKGLSPMAIYYTGGTQMHVAKDPLNGAIKGWNVPKQDLIHSAQILVQQHRVKVLPTCRRRDEMVAQLKGFKGRINEQGKLSADAMTDELHDDMVNHLLMASWYFTQIQGRLDDQASDIAADMRPCDTYPEWDPWEA